MGEGRKEREKEEGRGKRRRDSLLRRQKFGVEMGERQIMRERERLLCNECGVVS